MMSKHPFPGEGRGPAALAVRLDPGLRRETIQSRQDELNASSEEIMALTGLEMLQAVIAGTLPAPPIGATMGFRLIEVEPGRALFEGSAGPHLLNPLGGVHGGVALTLIDSAAGCAVHTELPAGIGYTTVETKVNFTRPVPSDGSPIRCEGRVVTRGRQIATAEARLLSADGKMLAHGTSTLIILPPRT